jgi:hypothetical protein
MTAAACTKATHAAPAFLNRQLVQYDWNFSKVRARYLHLEHHSAQLAPAHTHAVKLPVVPTDGIARPLFSSSFLFKVMACWCNEFHSLTPHLKNALLQLPKRAQ